MNFWVVVKTFLTKLVVALICVLLFALIAAAAAIALTAIVSGLVLLHAHPFIGLVGVFVIGILGAAILMTLEELDSNR